MGKITVLDNNLANMIAAGEVIERPSSVLKELIENSLDANATVVEIAITDAGRTKIIVNDNGDGMDKDDALLAFKRHATSKIKSEFDLFRIKTLGFRGEALPSIASVSQVTMVTATGLSTGTQLEAFEDQIKSLDASSKKGTLITVSELFYNTPARLKYLKSDYVENANNLEIVSRLALGHPDVSFTFSIDDKLQFKTSGRGEQLEAIMQIYGHHVAKQMLPFAYKYPDFSFSGYLGKPDLAKSNRYYMITLMNGRHVYMPKIQAALIEAYRDFLPPSRFPFLIVNLTVDPALLDVNVHPSKREIRFTKETELKDALITVIPKALLGSSLIATPLNVAKTPQTYRQDREKIEVMSLLEPSPDGDKVINQHVEKRQSINLTALAQLAGTFILASSHDGGLVLIDQHAAMERINYEKYQALAMTDAYTSAPLVPIIIDMKPSEERLLTDEKIEILSKTGLVLKNFGPHTYQVVSIPVWASEIDERMYVTELVDQIIHQDNIDILKIRDDTIASKSCKRSLKANQKLTLLEMQTLIQRLLNTNNPYSCPHGRPTMISFTSYDLEKMFKRTGF